MSRGTVERDVRRGGLGYLEGLFGGREVMIGTTTKPKVIQSRPCLPSQERQKLRRREFQYCPLWELPLSRESETEGDRDREKEIDR